ncbi:Maf family protein [Maridesulfovibrio bastinii]|uniref:Maf family protein n=1 Tax=Maridesulfovibrio bastinii TaxID=47157 RepID=UPI0004155F46|nr:Maf family protein [Maridesulfovibrio bastinii]
MIFKTMKPFILASGSPRRKELLENTGIVFTIHPSTEAEPEPQQGQLPEEYAKSLAQAKAESIFSQMPGNYVLGADTVVVEGQNILGKPTDKNDALRMVSSLLGKTHKVITGCAIITPDGEINKFHAITEVDFINCDTKIIEAYVATGESYDKAGAYAIQGKGAFLVKEVRGSYSNVVGLPLAKVIETLVSYGVIVPGDG